MFDNHQRILERAGALAFARAALAFTGAIQFAKYYDCKGEDLVAITTGANFEDFD